MKINKKIVLIKNYVIKKAVRSKRSSEGAVVMDYTVEMSENLSKKILLIQQGKK